MKYFFPFGYGFNTRAKTLAYRLSFFVVTVLPSLYIALMIGGLNIQALISYIVSFVAMYVVYEIGYIYNDVYTVGFEKSPTYRLSEGDYKYVRKKYPLMISTRLGVVIASVCYFFYYNSRIVLTYILLLFLLYLIYSIHNYTRSKVTAFTMLGIVWLKYLIPIVSFMDKSNAFECVLLSLCIIPFPRFVEYGSKDYCHLFKLRQYGRFRIIYYAVLLTCEVLGLIFTRKYIWHIPLIAVMLVYRCFTYIIEKKKGDYFNKKEVSAQCSK